MGSSTPTTFRSRHHPAGRPAAVVYGRALVRPLGACLTPIMIAATATALEGGSVFPLAAWGAPAALAVAWLWSRFRLAQAPAALHLRGGQAALQSVLDALHDRPLDWQPLLDVRITGDKTNLALGWDTVTLRRADWPEHDALQDALRAGETGAGGTPRPSAQTAARTP
jgi:hypothetical protein